MGPALRSASSPPERQLACQRLTLPGDAEGSGDIRLGSGRRQPAYRRAGGRAFFTEKFLPTQHDALAPDGSLVRLLPSLAAGSMAHFELGAGEISRPQQHRTVSEIWYVLQGLGRMWRRQDGLEHREIDLRPGVALTIPVGTSFQFRNTGREPLAVLGVTMPPWPGEGEAIDVDGPWTPNLQGVEQ